MTVRHRIAFAGFMGAVGLCFAPLAFGIEDRADLDPSVPAPHGGIAWKLTPSTHHESAGHSAYDINLRGNRDQDTFWVAHYKRGGEFEQSRAGYEHQFGLPIGRVIASAQYASHGFVGGSATLEAGSPGSAFTGLLGLGRTNTRPYYNLNFDPNDSVLIGAGWKLDTGVALTLYQVRDDRLDTGQRVTHFVLRTPTTPAGRWTVDLFHRAGRADSTPDAETFNATGLALTYDHEPWFIKVARDPKVNFTPSDMTRVAIGVRF